MSDFFLKIQIIAHTRLVFWFSHRILEPVTMFFMRGNFGLCPATFKCLLSCCLRHMVLFSRLSHALQERPDRDEIYLCIHAACEDK